MAQDNLTQNTVSKATQAPTYGGMNQVCSGPAGLLYSLSNELIMIYNELQDLYGKVAVAETNVQKSTITASAAAQRQTANYQAITIGCQAGEALASGVVSGVTSLITNKANKTIDDDLTTLDNELKPLKTLDGMDKQPQNAQGSAMFGQGVGTARFDEVTPRMNDLLNRKYGYARPVNAPANFSARTDAAEIKQLDQHAINSMSPGQYRDYKDRLGNEISTKEKRLNSLQSERLNTSQTNKQYSDIFSQGANLAFKGVETATTALAGKEQATTQIANGVQSMANSTADSARGSIGQNYAKVSDVIASARQGANAYAQT